MEGAVRSKLAVLVTGNINIFHISEVQKKFSPSFPPPHTSLSPKSTLACVYREVLRTWISSVTFSYTLFQEEKGSLVSTRPLALEVIHWQGKCIAVGVLSAARDTGKNASSYLGWWWSSHLLSGGVVMSIPGTPICSTFPSPTNWGRRWGRKKISHPWTPTASNVGLLTYQITSSPLRCSMQWWVLWGTPLAGTLATSKD